MWPVRNTEVRCPGASSERHAVEGLWAGVEANCNKIWSLQLWETSMNAPAPHWGGSVGRAGWDSQAVLLVWVSGQGGTRIWKLPHPQQM